MCFSLVATTLPHSGVPGAIAPRAPNGALLGVCAAHRHVGPLPQALACNPFGHATCESAVNQDTWQVGSPTETCIMAEKCMLKTTMPTGECLGHRGHQCKSCHGWHHNICMGVFDPTARDSCGRADCKPSESAPVLIDAPLQGPLPAPTPPALPTVPTAQVEPAGPTTSGQSETSHDGLPPSNAPSVPDQGRSVDRQARVVRCAVGKRAKSTIQVINQMTTISSHQRNHLNKLLQASGTGGEGGTAFGPKSYPCGTVMSGSAAKGWKLHWDILGDQPDKNFTVHRRTDFIVLEEDDKEMAEEDTEAEWDSLPSDGDSVSVKGFEGLDFKGIRAAKSVKLYFKDQKKHPNAHVEWKIHANSDYPTLPRFPTAAEMETNLSADVKLGEDSMVDILFNHILPPVTGHGVLMDAYHSDPRAPQHHSYQAMRKLRPDFRFAQTGDDVDPDGLIKMCTAVMVAGTTETENGVDLWTSGKGEGRKDPPDFGQHVNRDVFKMFRAAMPFMYAPRSQWHQEREMLTWDMFNPVIAAFNEMRLKLFPSRPVAAFLDESMTAWIPNHTKLGGLPNISCEPRKPKPLGTMLRNAIHVYWKCLLHQQTVMQPAQMQRLERFGAPSGLPNSATYGTATSECLRTAKSIFGDCRQLPAGDTVPRWIGGDAWFGSAATVVALMKELGVYGSFIVKGGTALCPKEQLIMLMKARHEHPTGNWATMSTELCGVKIFAVVYNWSKKGFTCFVSSAGSTEVSPTMYRTSYQTDTGETETKLIPRPAMADFVYKFAPDIDQHNRERQDQLDICGVWKTASPWFRLHTGVLGQSVVDLMRTCKAKMPRKYEDMHPRTFANRLLKDMALLCKRPARNTPTALDTTLGPTLTFINDEWVPCYKKNTKNIQQRHCNICKRYTEKMVWSTTACRTCNMSVCGNDFSTVDTNRVSSCLKEHLTTNVESIRCAGTMGNGKRTASFQKKDFHPLRKGKVQK